MWPNIWLNEGFASFSHPFFRILRNWAAEHQHGNATTAQFIDLAQRISGQDLSAFFQTWLYTAGKPTTW